MIGSVRRWTALLPVVLNVACSAAPSVGTAPAPADTGFAPLIERLSEPGGFFPSDNLVSNETSYLHVLGKMEELGVSGGAYLGVGPDQNFSYIAALRPEVAFIIDIRRDNLLHHLLFKALFENARNRVEYLCLLLGRPVPESLTEWDGATIGEIVEYIDDAAKRPDLFAAAAVDVRESVERYGLPLSENEYSTIIHIHHAFHDRGLDLRYSYSARHPTYRQLLLGTDLAGEPRNYLASEERFRFVKELHRRNRIIPVVGDLAGPHALAAIGQEVVARRLRISAFYVSNVEQYLMRGPEFERFAETLTRLPYDRHSMLIRSYFGRGGSHPLSVPGHFSTQLLEPVHTFVDAYRAGDYRGYMDLVTRNVLPLRE